MVSIFIHSQIALSLCTYYNDFLPIKTSELLKETPERNDKKTATNSVAPVPTNNSSKPSSSTSQTSNNTDKEARKEAKEKEREQRDRERGRDREREKERERERESSEKAIVVEKKSSKESKRLLEKEDGDTRKRERGEKRRDRKVAPSSPQYTPAPASPKYDAKYEPSTDYTGTSYPQSPEYNPPHFEANDRFYDDGRHRADRDLSSVSNSSKGSTNRRSQESPDHEREMKRRRIDGSKVFNSRAKFPRRKEVHFME